MRSVKASLICITILFFKINAFSQIKYEPGYFIDLSNKVTECQIRNVDWNKNPSKFKYILPGSEEPLQVNADSVKEFGFENGIKFVIASVLIDRSSYELLRVSNQRNPEFKQERLFLKVLTDGNAKLYYYQGENQVRFFYQIGSSGINQLIYKKYRVKDNISTNKSYLQQLWTEVNCDKKPLSSLGRIKYDTDDLLAYFLKYNECSGDSIINVSKQDKRDFFNLRVATGISYSSITFTNVPRRQVIDFDSKITTRVGIQAEFILPFHKNKWGLIAETNFHHFDGFKQVGVVDEAEIKLRALEFPIGLRHYFYFNKNLKFFVNILYVMNYNQNFTSNFKVKYPIFNKELNTGYGGIIGVGGGYNRIDLEIRFNANQQLLTPNYFWNTQYNRLSFTFYFKLF